MEKIGERLILARCPHCHVAMPHLQRDTILRSIWEVYFCAKCNGAVLVKLDPSPSKEVRQVFPSTRTIDQDVPTPVREYLTQALDSLHAPIGSIMLSASAVDAMLKLKGYDDRKQSLYERIEKAAADHVITSEMAAWAHDVRLDANDQRHADPTVPLPSSQDADRCLDFATALAEYMFVLPARVLRGRQQKSP